VMRVWNTIAEWRGRRQSLEGSTLGFVPTMGALHAGHTSLVERCRRENDIVAVSIFVNPWQFNDPSDLQKYPRRLDQDRALLESLGADDLLVPPASEMYPDGLRFRLEPGEADRVLEGAYRPGFLEGVLTIVLKLLNLVRADRAYFGEKDYQQLRIVSDMVKEFFLTTEIVPCPTVREQSGLAMSSRNALLSPECRRHAARLYRVLKTAATPSEATAGLQANGFTVDYVEDLWGRRLAAASLGGVRLIDNVALAEIGLS
jgi:pantoate--beta-alanine ligase